jgi:hypothetical protein
LLFYKPTISLKSTVKPKPKESMPPLDTPVHQHKDRFNYLVKPGQRVLVSAIIMTLDPSRPDGPIVVQIGDGETPGFNISVLGKHLSLHPDEAHVPLGTQPATPIMASAAVDVKGNISADAPLTEGGAPVDPKVIPFNPTPGAPAASAPAAEPPVATALTGPTPNQGDTLSAKVNSKTPDVEQPVGGPSNLAASTAKTGQPSVPVTVVTPQGTVASVGGTSTIPKAADQVVTTPAAGSAPAGTPLPGEPAELPNPVITPGQSLPVATSAAPVTPDKDEEEDEEFPAS